jgi:hypothetical protein
MNQLIEDYIREHRDKYTREAIREQLLAAGHDMASVDAALAESAPPTGKGANDSTRKTFSRWALGLHATAFVGVVGVLWLIYGSRVSVYLGIGAVILAVVLLVGWGISSLIGRALLSPSRLAAALAVPALSALVIGGSCFALLSGTARPPSQAGTLSIQVTGGLTFTGSGLAICSGTPGSGSMSVFAQELGTVDGGVVNASVFIYGESSVGPASPSISVGNYQSQDPQRGTEWSSDGREQSNVDSSADDLSGTVTFSNLMFQGTPDTGSGSAPLAGSITWNCP